MPIYVAWTPGLFVGDDAVCLFVLGHLRFPNWKVIFICKHTKCVDPTKTPLTPKHKFVSPKEIIHGDTIQTNLRFSYRRALSISRPPETYEFRTHKRCAKPPHTPWHMFVSMAEICVGTKHNSNLTPNQSLRGTVGLTKNHAQSQSPKWQI